MNGESSAVKKLNAVLVMWVDLAIFFLSLLSTLWWISGKGLFYSPISPVLSPFTSFSLMLISGARLAMKHLTAFPAPFALTLLIFVIAGNISSLTFMSMFPNLFLTSFPTLVATSRLTSFGLIAFALYEVLILFRTTPRRTFIMDDILLHLALIPGGISLLGHALNNIFYISSLIDPRVGIGYFEMFLMASNAGVALLGNPHLFLWRFLKKKLFHVFVFGALFLNQYIAPVIVGFISERTNQATIGIELFVYFAGVLATLLFLLASAFQAHSQKSI